MKLTKEFVEKESFYRQMNNLTKHHEGIYNGAVDDCMNLLDDSPVITEKDIRNKAIQDTVAAIKKHTQIVGSTTCEDLDEIEDMLLEQ